MAQDTTADHRYEWSIVMEVDGEELRSLFEGDDSAAMLGNVFAMWLRGRGDVSRWGNVDPFGELVVAYSDLGAEMVAVWLGIDSSRFDSGELKDISPAEEVSWRMAGPNGEPMTVRRRVVD